MSRSEAEDFDIGDEVAIKLEVQKTVDNESEDSKGDGKKSAKKSKNTTEWVEVTKNGPIQGKEYVPELKQYRYWVDIELEEGSVLEGSDVEIQASKYGKSMTWLSQEAALLKAGGRQVCL